MGEKAEEYGKDDCISHVKGYVGREKWTRFAVLRRECEAVYIDSETLV